MAGADGNAHSIEQHAQIVRVHAIHNEAHHASTVLGLTDEPHARNIFQQFPGMRPEHLLVRRDVRDPHTLHPFQGHAQPDRLGDRRRSRLKLERHFRERRSALQIHVRNHLPAAAPGRHLRQQLGTPIEHPNPRRPVRFVTAEHIKIRPQRLDVNLRMGRPLRTIDHGDRPHGMRRVDPALDIIHRPKRIAHVAESHELHSRHRQFPLKILRIEFALICDLDNRQLSALFGGEHLPGDEVGVMVHPRDNQYVACGDVEAAPGLGY